MQGRRGGGRGEEAEGRQGERGRGEEHFRRVGQWGVGVAEGAEREGEGRWRGREEGDLEGNGRGRERRRRIATGSVLAMGEPGNGRVSGETGGGNTLRFDNL